MRDGPPPHRFAVATELPALGLGKTGPGETEADRAHRLVLRTAVRACDARHRHGEIHPGAGERAPGHFQGNGAATVVARAESEGTVIGVKGYVNGVDIFQGHASGDTIVRDSWRSETLDFSNTELVDIAEVDAGSGNDTIMASDVSPGKYRGGSGYDTLDAGAKETTWLFAGDGETADIRRAERN